MKKFLSKTFKFKKLTVSIFHNEIILIYIGNRRIYIKTIRLNFISLRKKLIYSSIGIAVLILFIYTIIPSDNNTPVFDDSLEKNRLLLSSKTDYSSPENLKRSKPRLK